MWRVIIHWGDVEVSLLVFGQRGICAPIFGTMTSYLRLICQTNIHCHEWGMLGRGMTWRTIHCHRAVGDALIAQGSHISLNGLPTSIHSIRQMPGGMTPSGLCRHARAPGGWIGSISLSFTHAPAQTPASAHAARPVAAHRNRAAETTAAAETTVGGNRARGQTETVDRVSQIPRGAKQTVDRARLAHRAAAMRTAGGDQPAAK